ncbi:Zinc finger, CCHC-type domain-containing protein [Strongyloides ratti]|uniref:Zinc finger, CCHC-type domain-containing protein n=1 Tax=Strongyloides ratti TaxID=34506 RepID=A0A090KV23_STRRB|nr:Zinc finger, CCHC-type domain-containing protein [Strongyloides ratti]CEF61370.1 Zinc finger, CCHC-type domain-containing protein [Strongyloides ratti]
MITKTHYLTQRTLKSDYKETKDQRQIKKEATPTLDRVCYECNEKGHMKPNCPRLKKPTTTRVAKIRRNADDFNASSVKSQLFQFAVPGADPIYQEAYFDTMAEITVIFPST